MQLVRNPNRTRHITREHSSRKTVDRVVRLVDNVVLVFEFSDGDDGPEDLFLDDLHLGLDVGEDGGLDEVAFVAVALATKGDGRTLGFAGLDVAHNALQWRYLIWEILRMGKRTYVELDLGDLRSLEGLALERVSDLELRDMRRKLLNELVVHARLDEHTRASAAALSVVKANYNSSVTAPTSPRGELTRCQRQPSVRLGRRPHH